MEMLSFVLTLGALALAFYVFRAHVQHQYAIAFVLCGGGLMCLLAAIAVDFVRNDYPHTTLQVIMLVCFSVYLVWKREYDPFSTPER